MMMRFKVLLPRPQERCPTAASELHLIRIAAAGEIFAPKSAEYDFGDAIHQYGNYFISLENKSGELVYKSLRVCLIHTHTHTLASLNWPVAIAKVERLKTLAALHMFLNGGHIGV
jgi:hypothetical protein